MTPSGTIVLAAFVALGFGAACSVSELEYEGKTCPCPSGYRCERASNTCAAGEGGPSNCAAESACGALPNQGLNLVAVRNPVDPWIDCSKNCLGIYAPITTHTVGDAELRLDVSSGALCMAGSIGPYSNVELDIALGDYDAAAHGLNGFELSISGTDVPVRIYFGYYYYADSVPARCAILFGEEDRRVVPFEGPQVECGTGVQVDPTTLQRITNVAVFVAATEAAETFDFCVPGLAGIR